jgi:hypothetical protein
VKTCRRTSSHKVTTVLVGTRGKPEKDRERKREQRERKSGQLQKINIIVFKKINFFLKLKKNIKKKPHLLELICCGCCDAPPPKISDPACDEPPGGAWMRVEERTTPPSPMLSLLLTFIGLTEKKFKNKSLKQTTTFPPTQKS